MDEKLNEIARLTLELGVRLRTRDDRKKLARLVGLVEQITKERTAQ